MSFKNEFRKICALIFTVQLLLALTVQAQVNWLLYGIVNPIEQASNGEILPWLKPGLLNSTRIELKFGSYGVEVLAQDPSKGFRLSNLYSVHEHEKIARTIAFTLYETNINEKLIRAHQEIMAGGSIGTTLKKFGFALKKDFIFKGILSSMPDQLQNLMHTQESSFAAVIYNLVAKAGDDELPYCTILEVYSPEFLTLKEVDLVYSESENVDSQTAHEPNDIIYQMKQLLMKG